MRILAHHPDDLVQGRLRDRPHVPAADQQSFHAEMAELGVKYQFNSYPGAKHGFTNPDATEKGRKYNLPLAYDEKTDRQSWDDMKAFWTRVFR